jgi:hypothetical protein
VRAYKRGLILQVQTASAPPVAVVS